MKKKAQATTTLNPFHFEDLEPHRFEDLVRQLAYEFKDWQTVEATGRGGSDDGMDIRAFEKRHTVSDSDDDDAEVERTVEGNLWVIQCKREKELGPGRVKAIVEAGPFAENSVYGYILAAPVNFSKKSYDVFREELRRKGVAEFYLWGRAELEDMLLMPRNDHILFTFFGISLSVRRRTRTSEAKFRVNNKNKLFRVFGIDRAAHDFHIPVLLRDINDTHYPWKENCPDFVERPPWEEYDAYDCHPQGLLVHMHKYHAYLDKATNEFDFMTGADMVFRQAKCYEERDEEAEEIRDRIEHFWQHLPRSHQAFYVIDGLVAWEDILLIDDKGDGHFECPHIYVESKPHTDLVSGMLLEIESNGLLVPMKGQFKRKPIFPKSLPKTKKPKPCKEKGINLDPLTLDLLVEHHNLFVTLYDIEGKYKSLRARDVVPINNQPTSQEPLFLEVTHEYTTTKKEYVTDITDSRAQASIEKQVGRQVQDYERLHVYECRRLNKWQVES